MQNLLPLRSAELTGIVHNSAAYDLIVAQQPSDGRALSSPRRNARGAVKWPLDPPCVVELILHDNDPSKAYLHSPYWFCTIEIEALNHESLKSDTLTGTLTSSLHKVKMHDSRDHGVFVFGDLYVKYPGYFRLKFTVFEMRQG
ncbi:hypothetical protein A1O3_02516 [Capronia epimyces CBS 606.96]|uniref:Velvet domain-containing protein n=1 Tax=Capronia epimyces CBS 606.96 TaxID=1182542 RepID=W9Z4N7_9EURO|nr:uncharacterized protein A1O3_02516 [Capronia epimyces CBS 606.96]EXJ89449.1 hypothetical protein A1O3_02516 [Capronia epimyces CBS 606.96]